MVYAPIRSHKVMAANGPSKMLSRLFERAEGHIIPTEGWVWVITSLRPMTELVKEVAAGADCDVPSRCCFKTRAFLRLSTHLCSSGTSNTKVARIVPEKPLGGFE